MMKLKCGSREETVQQTGSQPQQFSRIQQFFRYGNNTIGKFNRFPFFEQGSIRFSCKVGQRATTVKPAGNEQKLEVQQRTQRLSRQDISALHVTISGPPEVPLRYKVSNLMDFVNWLNSLTVVGAEPQLVTWFHLNLLYEKALGFQYSKSHKRWRFVQTDTKYLGFVQCSNHFARFTKGLLEAIGFECISDQTAWRFHFGHNVCFFEFDQIS